MKALNWIAWISGCVGALILLLGIAFPVKPAFKDYISIKKHPALSWVVSAALVGSVYAIIHTLSKTPAGKASSKVIFDTSFAIRNFICSSTNAAADIANPQKNDIVYQSLFFNCLNLLGTSNFLLNRLFTHQPANI